MSGPGELIVCNKCNGYQYMIVKKVGPPHGYGLYCAKCRAFVRWTGSGEFKNKKQTNSFDREKLKAKGLNFCHLCGITEEEAKKFNWQMQIDHTLAEMFGGPDDIENKRYLCTGCHQIKCSLENRSKVIRRLLNED